MKDINDRTVQLFDRVYKAQLGYGKSALLLRYLVVGFTPQKVRVVSCTKHRPYDYQARRVSDVEVWVGHKTISPDSMVVVNEHDWPEADQFIQEQGFLYE